MWPLTGHWTPKSAQLIKFGSEIEIEHSKKQTEAQVVPDFVAPLPLDQKIEKNNSEISHEVKIAIFQTNQNIKIMDYS